MCKSALCASYYRSFFALFIPFNTAFLKLRDRSTSDFTQWFRNICIRRRGFPSCWFVQFSVRNAFYFLIGGIFPLKKWNSVSIMHKSMHPVLFLWRTVATAFHRLFLICLHILRIILVQDWNFPSDIVKCALIVFQAFKSFGERASVVKLILHSPSKSAASS